MHCDFSDIICLFDLCYQLPKILDFDTNETFSEN